MPIYVYQCPDCDRRIEEHRHVSERYPGPFCECLDGCGRMLLVITPTSFVLKGDGWASDGYAKGRS